ncbi:5'-nucleotidase, lipoprotein e(P4) family [Olivibacter sp. XZL3]|uniref:5'-nucleotidase, lipoprotein e(P4) family n=1 Tax=Olivibacter sp. XZL3 TaxID=1735116 RepID=UPI001066BFEE|nr:5'-nucleotidase, lipoprotein e(P4) family [Olivibacter sp. XZL3]
MFSKSVFSVIGFLLAAASTYGQEYHRDYTNAVLWQQQSGEYRALCFQAYNFARLSLDKKLKKRSRKPKCIVVDVDETLLDNSPHSAQTVRSRKSFDLAEWKRWTGMAVADTVPGACSFLQYAASKNVEVFYISNRDRSEIPATIENLKRYGFPYVDNQHLLFRDTTSNKQPRRDLVAGTHEIIMLAGDNLSDFSTIFYQEGKDAKSTVDQQAKLFGTEFIVLPNPMYGDWEQSLYPKGNLTEEEKSEIRLNRIKGY